ARLRGLHAKSELHPGGPPPRPRPQPKPKKKDGKPGDKPEFPEPPMPDPHAELKKLIPEQWKDWFVAKPGFANYRFNQLEQDRVLASLKSLGDFSSATGSWRLSGQSAAGDPFELTLAPKGIGLEIRDAAFFQQLEETDAADEPPGTGGFLIGVHHLRLLLSKGTSAFTECLYFGSEPLDGRGELVDVLVSTLSAVETRWYFSRVSGVLVGFDTQLHEDAEACVVRFAGLADFAGMRLPQTWSVRSGEKEFATLRVEKADFVAKKGGS
ncbi:MAG TPA: serine protease, partial [Planctomycetaceae bacterium]|nr:serine protease [Planctomycetaceae bacterium]